MTTMEGMMMGLLGDSPSSAVPIVLPLKLSSLVLLLPLHTISPTYKALQDTATPLPAPVFRFLLLLLVLLTLTTCGLVPL
jgi:hypothetical protein